MRNIFYILLCVVLFACGKEDSLDSQICLDDLYAIQDVPEDPVKHEIYNIYKEYGVPVYFNDTIGKILLKYDKDGNPVYQIEKLDLAWKYSSYEKMNYTYSYITDKKRQMEVLGWIREYLNNADKALYPFCFFIPDSIFRENLDNDEVIILEDLYLLGFRSLTMIGGNWKSGNEQKNLVNMKRSMVVQKINNFSNDLIDFKKVTDDNSYGHKYWNEVSDLIPKYYKCDVLDPEYAGRWTGEALRAKQVEARGYIGPLGFVMGAEMGNGLFTPWDKDEDIKCYVKVMLATPDTTFRKQWGIYPLVMEKYEVLYQIITEKLGVEL